MPIESWLKYNAIFLFTDDSLSIFILHCAGIYHTHKICIFLLIMNNLSNFKVASLYMS